jgi:hypothetical protein
MAVVQTFDVTPTLAPLRLKLRAVKYCHMAGVQGPIFLSRPRLRKLVSNKMETVRKTNLLFSLTIMDDEI